MKERRSDDAARIHLTPRMDQMPQGAGMVIDVRLTERPTGLELDNTMDSRTRLTARIALEEEADVRRGRVPLTKRVLSAACLDACVRFPTMPERMSATDWKTSFITVKMATTRETRTGTSQSMHKSKAALPLTVKSRRGARKA